MGAAFPDENEEGREVVWYDIAESDEDGPGETTSHDEPEVWTAGRLRRLWGLRSATQQRVVEEAKR